MKHFVLILPFALPQVQDMVSKHVAAKGFGYWHWCAECWLLTSHDQTLDAAKVRDIVQEVIFLPVTYMVLYVELPQAAVGWAFTGPNTNGWAEWLRTNWEKKNVFGYVPPKPQLK